MNERNQLSLDSKLRSLAEENVVMETNIEAMLTKFNGFKVAVKDSIEEINEKNQLRLDSKVRSLMEKNEVLETNVNVLMTKFNEFQTDLKQLIAEGKCMSLGSNYRFILDTCYYFDKSRKNFNEAKQNCREVFGPNTHGKLMEPKSTESLEKIQELAKTIFGSDYVLTGFKKQKSLR